MTTADPSTPHSADPTTVDGLVGALTELTRAQRETGALVARELGCSAAALTVLTVLEGRGPLQLGELAHTLRIDLSVASRQVSALVDSGHVGRSVDPADRRARTLSLTDTGHDLARTAKNTWRSRAEDVFGDWTPDQLHDAVVQLRRIADSAVRHHDLHTSSTTGKSRTA